MNSQTKLIVFTACLAALLHPLFAQTVVQPKQAVVLLQSGEIEIENLSGEVRKVANDTAGSASEKVQTVNLEAGELIRTSKDSFCDVMIPSVGTMRVTPESEIRLPGKVETERRKQHSMELLKGKLFMDVDAVQLQRTQQKQFRLKTPTTILAVRGTQLFAEVQGDKNIAGVHKGQIAVLEVQSGRTTPLTAGRAVEASPGKLSVPRALSAAEQTYADYYAQFALTQVAVESAARKAEAKYEYNMDGGKSVILTNDKKKYKFQKTKVPGINGNVLQV